MLTKNAYNLLLRVLCEIFQEQDLTEKKLALQLQLRFQPMMESDLHVSELADKINGMNPVSYIAVMELTVGAFLANQKDLTSLVSASRNETYKRLSDLFDFMEIAWNKVVQQCQADRSWGTITSPFEMLVSIGELRQDIYSQRIEGLNRKIARINTDMSHSTTAQVSTSSSSSSSSSLPGVSVEVSRPSKKAKSASTADQPVLSSSSSTFRLNAESSSGSSSSSSSRMPDQVAGAVSSNPSVNLFVQASPPVYKEQKFKVTVLKNTTPIEEVLCIRTKSQASDLRNSLSKVFDESMRELSVDDFITHHRTKVLVGQVSMTYGELIFDFVREIQDVREYALFSGIALGDALEKKSAACSTLIRKLLGDKNSDVGSFSLQGLYHRGLLTPDDTRYYVLSNASIDGDMDTQHFLDKVSPILFIYLDEKHPVKKNIQPSISDYEKKDLLAVIYTSIQTLINQSSSTSTLSSRRSRRGAADQCFISKIFDRYSRDIGGRRNNHRFSYDDNHINQLVELISIYINAQTTARVPINMQFCKAQLLSIIQTKLPSTVHISVATMPYVSALTIAWNKFVIASSRVKDIVSPYDVISSIPPDQTRLSMDNRVTIEAYDLSSMVTMPSERISQQSARILSIRLPSANRENFYKALKGFSEKCATYFLSDENKIVFGGIAKEYFSITVSGPGIESLSFSQSSESSSSSSSSSSSQIPSPSQQPSMPTSSLSVLASMASMIPSQIDVEENSSSSGNNQPTPPCVAAMASRDGTP